MSAAATSIAMTLEEWAELDEDDSRELIDGFLEEEEMPSAIHETVVRWLMMILDRTFGGQGGFVFGSGLKLAVRMRSGRMPDVSWYGPGKKPEARGVVRVPPDIVVEVVSPTPRDERRDRIEKPDDYAAFGVKYYWMVDPEFRSFEVWELGSDGRYVRAAAATSGAAVRVPGYENFTIDLDALWAEVERLEKTE
ncbi:MAG: Uma2 family endonuclease [Polyangiaceae bacterium]